MFLFLTGYVSKILFASFQLPTFEVIRNVFVQAGTISLFSLHSGPRISV